MVRNIAVTAGENDLLTTNPSLAAEWNFELNQELGPDQVRETDTRKVWWRCSEFPNHRWIQSPYLRSKHGFGCAICSGKQLQVGVNDLATTHPDLATEWHSTLNLPLKLEEVRASTPRKVFWVCNRDETHVWQALISNRAKLGRGCPICANVKIVAGINDFASAYEVAAKQWHPSRNGGLLPTQCSPHSSRQVWWICEFGHEWKTSIAKRAIGRGCPFCVNQSALRGFNDLETAFPEISKTWDSVLNGQTTPSMVVPKSNKKFWWRCPIGHTYRTSPGNRVRGNNCPYCANVKLLVDFNDLATMHPDLATLWDYEQNSPVTPREVIGASGKYFFWKCSQGHSFRKSADSLKRSGCPVCSNYLVIRGVNDLATAHPELVKEWDFSKNREFDPTQIPAGTHKKAWWVCQKGHEWHATVVSRTGVNGTGCPSCANSGFDDLKPAILYFIEQPDLRARKIGITNSDNKGSRIQRFESRGWTVLFTLENESGKRIHQTETRVIRWLRRDQKMPPFLDKNEMPGFGGYSETFSSQGVSNTEVIEQIESCFADLMPKGQ